VNEWVIYLAGCLAGVAAYVFAMRWAGRPFAARKTFTSRPETLHHYTTSRRTMGLNRHWVGEFIRAHTDEQLGKLLRRDLEWADKEIAAAARDGVRIGGLRLDVRFTADYEP
jgi:hypothetical protein